MGALDHIVRSGKALYVGISNYNAEQTRIAVKTLRAMGTPMLIHQPRYNMLDRWIENGLTDVLREEGVGSIVFSPLAGGRLTGKYQNGIPADSRAGHDPRYLKPEMIDKKLRACTAALAGIAQARGQTTAQLALQWTLRDGVVTSALIGASRPQQVIENIAGLDFPALTESELTAIDEALKLAK